MCRVKNILFMVVISILSTMSLMGCAMGPTIASPQELVAPKPIPDNSGKYMSPYTQDGVLAEWTDKAINAKLGSTIGKHVGAYAGQKALEQIPFIGGHLGSALGNELGRKIAIESSGGMKTIKNSSDMSFNSLEDISVYLYVNYSNNEHYREALSATCEIYPKLKKAYYSALVSATKKQRKS